MKNNYAWLSSNFPILDGLHKLGQVPKNLSLKPMGILQTLAQPNQQCQSFEAIC